MYSPKGQKSIVTLSRNISVALLACIALSSTAFAGVTPKAGTIQLVAVGSNINTSDDTDMDVADLAMDDESEIGAVASMNGDSKLGSFSEEDGAMVGFYGDAAYDGDE